MDPLRRPEPSAYLPARTIAAILLQQIALSTQACRQTCGIKQGRAQGSRAVPALAGGLGG